MVLKQLNSEKNQPGLKYMVNSFEYIGSLIEADGMVQNRSNVGWQRNANIDRHGGRISVSFLLKSFSSTPPTRFS